MTASALDGSIDEIRSAAERMQQDARFKAVFEEFPALSDADIEAWQDWLRQQPDMQDYAIPQELRDVYRATGGFRFRWQYLPAKKPTTGSAQIVDLMSLYQADEERTNPISAIYSEPRAFDVIDQQEVVVIRFGRQGALSLVRRQRESAAERPLSLQPVRYVKMLATFLGRYDWQRLFEAETTAKDTEIEALQREVARLLQPAKG